LGKRERKNGGGKKKETMQQINIICNQTTIKNSMVISRESALWKRVTKSGFRTWVKGRVT